MAVLEIVENSKEQVIVKVNAKTPLEVAKHSYLSAKYEYITITKGSNHIFTIVYTDGHTWSFHWGWNGYTLVSDDVEFLRKKIVSFIESNGILLDACTTEKPVKLCIYYNTSYKKWQGKLTFADGEYASYFSDKVESAEELKNEINNVFKVSFEKLIPGAAQTGIEIWESEIV